MRTFALVSLLVLIAAPAALAMDTSQIAWFAHGGISMPTGDFGDVAGMGFGGGVGGMMPYNETINLRGQVGYTYYGGKDEEVLGVDWSWNWSMIPIWFMGEYMFDPAIYGVGGLGFVMARSSFEYEDPWSGQTIDDDSSDTEFGFTFGAGYRMSEVLNLEARYSIVDDFNYFSAEAVYYF